MDMSATEILGWQEYFSIYETKRDRTDAQVGLICSILMNSQRTKLTDKVFTPRDFIPDYLNENTPQEKSMKQQIDEANAFFEKYQKAMST